MVLGLLLLCNGTASFREERDELDGWYTLIGCQMIEAPSFRIPDCGTVFTAICDEEALLNGNDTPLIFGIHGEPVIHGNVFVCKTRDGEFADLSEEDCKCLVSHFRAAVIEGAPKLVLRDAVIGA